MGPTITIITLIVLMAFAVLSMPVVFKRDLMMLQQNSYRNDRYTRWFNTSNESTTVTRMLTCIALFLILVHNIPTSAGAVIASAILIYNTVKLLTAKYKKPLVFTNRAKRIFGVMLGVGLLIPAIVWVSTMSLTAVDATLMVELVASPLILLMSNALLRPVEKSINRRYYNEARDMLASMPDLKIVGITGSYGKTSTKHYLHRILSEHFDTLMTPGSFNTTLGVIRTVREHLKPYNEVFIVEMGAKQPGDIKEICELVKPSMGIVTAVGEQHLESFKSIENVQKTKFELVDSLPADGLAVVNNDFPYVANRDVTNVECVRYAVSHPEGADFTASDIVYSPTGTSFTVSGPGKKLELHTRLVGECNISNLIAAVIIAMRLGVPDDKIKYAVEKIEQVEHRLNMKHTPGGITIIDDAFNSNPDGSRMAVDVLARMTGGKRIIVTPGMIELGDKQREYNRRLGEQIGRGADVAIVVGEYNREAILEGIADAGVMPKDSVHAVRTFAEAQQVLARIARAGDTVLYENDLPDTFK